MQDDIDVQRKWPRRLVPVLVLILGLVLTVVLVKSRKKPKRKPKKDTGLLVEVVQAKKQRRTVVVKGHGTVQPRRVVGIVPQVVGKLQRVHPRLVQGGMIRAGETLLVIDPADYRLAVERAKALVAKAEQSLAMAQSSAKVAIKEWKLLGASASRGQGKPSPLTLHEPQLRSAHAGLASAQADLKLARLSLSRTIIRAPFNLRVRRESVEKDQYVMAGRELATIYGTDQAEVVVPLPTSELRWLSIPRGDKAGKGRASGAKVTILQELGGVVHQRPARLARTVGEIDATGRMSRVVVSIQDPYNLTYKGEAYRPELEMGAFVEVRIEGQALEEVIPIQANALRLGSVVWVAGADNKLQVRKVAVARLTKTEAYITKGLKQGDRVVLTNISGVVEGMKLRLKVKKKKKPKVRERKRRGGRRGRHP